MEKPGAGVKLAKGRVGSRRGGELGHGGSTSIDGLAKRVEFLQCGVPLAGEDIAGQLAPMGGDGEIGVSGEDAEVVEVIGGTAVVSVRVLELAKVVEGCDLLERNLREGDRVGKQGKKERY